MIISMKENPGARIAEVTNTYGAYVNTELIAANAADTSLSDATRAFYQQQQVNVQQRDEYIEVNMQRQVVDGNLVYPITDKEYLPSAPLVMQGYIMAHPPTLERAFDTGDVFTGETVTGNSAIVGKGNIHYDTVMNQHVRVDEEHSVIVRSSYVDAIIPPLTPTEQLYIQTTWETLDGLIDDDDDEFTDRFKDIEYF